MQIAAHSVPISETKFTHVQSAIALVLLYDLCNWDYLCRLRRESRCCNFDDLLLKRAQMPFSRVCLVMIVVKIVG